MHYELYIDLLFLENFHDGQSVASCTESGSECKSNWQRIFLGGGSWNAG